jgi:starch synthase (maltosyl-transferring)
MRQPEKMIIYNLFPLLAGTFESWEGHLKRAAEMGFNWIFVNPVNLPGLSGSLYSIKDYFSLNPLLINKNSNQSPDEQIKEAIRTAENLGLRMMIDLVINHCSVDSLLIKEHPQWFQWEKKGKVAHPFANENGKKVVWGDLAKFDHRNTRDGEGLYHFFFEIVQYLVELGFHGFRCDAAYQLPGRLWERLIRETKKRYPDTLFFAETLGCTSDQTRKTASAGFDYIFNSSKWWDFKSPWLMEQYNLTRETAPSVSFPESHDTQRLFDELKGNIDKAISMVLSSDTFFLRSFLQVR